MKNNLSFKKYPLILLCTISAVGIALYKFLFLKKEVASIGIIGGADGPTTIFLTSKFINPEIIIFSIIFIVSLGIYIFLKR